MQAGVTRCTSPMQLHTKGLKALIRGSACQNTRPVHPGTCGSGYRGPCRSRHAQPPNKSREAREASRMHRAHTPACATPACCIFGVIATRRGLQEISCMYGKPQGGRLPLRQTAALVAPLYPSSRLRDNFIHVCVLRKSLPPPPPTRPLVSPSLERMADSRMEDAPAQPAAESNADSDAPCGNPENKWLVAPIHLLPGHETDTQERVAAILASKFVPEVRGSNHELREHGKPQALTRIVACVSEQAHVVGTTVEQWDAFVEWLDQWCKLNPATAEPCGAFLLYWMQEVSALCGLQADAQRLSCRAIPRCMASLPDNWSLCMAAGGPGKVGRVHA